jgi:hypothetical protein
MTKTFVCRQCKKEKQEDQRTLFKEDKIGFVLFQPLCEECLAYLQSHSLDELFPIKLRS